MARRHDCRDDHGCSMCYLDQIHEKINDGDVEIGMDQLVSWLSDKRRSSDGESWREFVDFICLGHPIRDVLHSDPFTWRAFHKPRGYPGDAETLDLIYAQFVPSLSSLRPVLSEPLDRLHRYTSGCKGSASHSVFERCSSIAAIIDAIARKKSDTRVLSIAAGHFREALLSDAIQSGDVEEIVAIDQDAVSVERMRNEYSGLPITAKQVSVREILADRAPVDSGFDLIYASGLFDYLAQRTAKALVRKMFGLLRKGGRLLVPNFFQNNRDIGYMESFMGWQLRHRNELEMKELAVDLPANCVESTHVSSDEAGNVVYLSALRNDVPIPDSLRGLASSRSHFSQDPAASAVD